MGPEQPRMISIVLSTVVNSWVSRRVTLNDVSQTLMYITVSLYPTPRRRHGMQFLVLGDPGYGPPLAPLFAGNLTLDHLRQAIIHRLLH